MSGRWCAALCIAIVLCATGAFGADVRAPIAKRDEAYVHELIARAHALHLFEKTTWLRLGHYHLALFGGWKSLADAKEFFLAEEGMSDPSAELDATLRGFFELSEPHDRRLQHPMCRFPARFSFLDSRLHFAARVPKRACPRFAEFVDKLRARSITLVFSSYYLNNPASAFGHTFLRINKQGRSTDETDLELLDYGIDFSATVDTNNAFIYAIKGLMGMFPGVYRRVPYYLKVREYNDHDSRDLWEYELNLTTPEVNLVVAHLWELGSNYFDYFYLSENCSYHVLDALEVANPRIRLLDRVGWPVLPADTVKAVVAEPGLVKKVRYRPSIRTQVAARLAGLTPKERDVVSALLADPAAPFPEDLDAGGRVRALDATLDIADSRYANDLTKPNELKDPHGERLKQALLERRAAMPEESEDLSIVPPFSKMPHVGHGSRRVVLGVGYSSARSYYDTVGFRLALHDLADPTDGYPETAAIEFLPTRLRYYVKQSRPSLEDFSLIRVTSLTPLTRFDHSWSWTVRAGAERVRDSACRDCLAAAGEFGAGWSFHLFTNRVLFFLLADAELLAPAHGGFWNALRAGIGPSGGLRLKLSSDLLALGTAQLSWLPEQEPRTTWRADATLRWQYVRGFAFDAGASAQPEAWSAQLASVLYF